MNLEKGTGGVGIRQEAGRALGEVFSSPGTFSQDAMGTGTEFHPGVSTLAPHTLEPDNSVLELPHHIVGCFPASLVSTR